MVNAMARRAPINATGTEKITTKGLKEMIEKREIQKLTKCKV